VCEFLLACATKRYPLTHAEGKVQAAQFILPTVAKVPNAMLRMEYVRLIAQRLDLDEAAVSEELRKVKPRELQPVRQRRPAAREPASGAQELFVALRLDAPARWDSVKEEDLLEQLGDGRLRRLVDMLTEWRAVTPQAPSPAQVISRLSDPEAAALVSRLVQLVLTIGDKEAAWRTCMQRLRGAARTRHLSHLETQLRRAQQSARDQEFARLLAD
jgi:DNA primase